MARRWIRIFWKVDSGFLLLPDRTFKNPAILRSRPLKVSGWFNEATFHRGNSLLEGLPEILQRFFRGSFQRKKRRGGKKRKKERKKKRKGGKKKENFFKKGGPARWWARLQTT